jgi:hypothetical protein
VRYDIYVIYVVSRQRVNSWETNHINLNCVLEVSLGRIKCHMKFVCVSAYIFLVNWLYVVKICSTREV